MKKSDFRHWVNNIWLENQRECYHFHEPEISMREYFNKYKYWLKREYQHQTKMDK